MLLALLLAGLTVFALLAARLWTSHRREHARSALQHALLTLTPAPAPSSWSTLGETQHRLGLLLGRAQGDDQVVELSHDPRVQHALRQAPPLHRRVHPRVLHTVRQSLHTPTAG